MTEEELVEVAGLKLRSFCLELAAHQQKEPEETIAAALAYEAFLNGTSFGDATKSYTQIVKERLDALSRLFLETLDHQGKPLEE